jgi:hypothetical protein
MRKVRSATVLFSIVVLASFLLLQLMDSRAVVRTVSAADAAPSFENFDIRMDDAADSQKDRADLLMREGVSADHIREQRNKIATASDLFIRSGTNIIENGVLAVPEVISPVTGAAFLTPPSSQARKSVLVEYLRRHADLIGVDPSVISQLEPVADSSNPDGNLSFVVLLQSVEGIPVFAGEIKAAFTRKNEIVRVINNLAPGARPDGYADRFGTAEKAVADALRFVPSESIQRDDVTAEKMLFPIDVGALRPAWRVLVYLRQETFYVVVDAQTGALLWRKNIGERQTLTATYGAYTSPAGLMRTADSPSPGTPFICAAPLGCTQPLPIARLPYTAVGNEAPDSFNNLGWIPDTGLPVRTPADPNITDGNNAEAGIDRDGSNGVDPQGHAVGSPARVFNPSYNPAPGIPPPGDDPTPPNPQTYPPTPYQQGLITHAFYTVNRFHDAAYRLGFNEQAGNFQHFNFGRGGSEGDRISFEVQDSSGTNGANFSAPADGGRGRLQMFLWTGSTPDRDGTLDSQMVVHELTHGITGRLHGNATGLGSNMARGMGEGWSDFFALALLSEPSDATRGVHAVSAYATYQLIPGYDSNYYYGIRRFPLATNTSIGTNGRPHDPLTFRYVNSNCDVLIGTPSTNPNSAFPRNPVISTSSASQACDQIHNLGEVWATILWEVRDQLIRRYGPAEGNRRVLQYTMDGMKISPLNPTMTQARDSILAAIQATNASDLRWAWRGFAIRGMGQTAAVLNPGSGANNTVVTESLDIPAAYRRPARADFDGDGRSDISVFRPSDRNWYLDRSTAGFGGVNWGVSTDVPIPGDYDGDNKADVAVHRGGGGSVFYILRSSDATVGIASWGVGGDIAAVEDYDGDGRDDITIFRPGTQTFWVLQSSNGAPVVSQSHRTDPASRPITGDFDGDGKADFGTVKDGLWIIYTSNTNYTQEYFLQLANNDTDRLVPADYDGDGVDDIAYYRPATGTWTIRRSSGGMVSVPFGIATDLPAPADFDGDGRADIAIYRDGQWWINGTTSGIRVSQFGLAGDVPVPASNTQ